MNTPARSRWLRLGRLVTITRDPLAPRRPTGLLYAFPAPRMRKATRATIAADLWARRAVR